MTAAPTQAPGGARAGRARTAHAAGPANGDLDHRSLEDLRRALIRRVDGEVRFDDGSRATYSTDASNFRQVPIGVVLPRSPEAGAAAVSVCHDFSVPVLSRGGGTSLAGQAANTAVVLDWSKYCDAIETGSA